MKLIYIADDDKNICDLFSVHLSRENYKTEVFYNGEDLYNAFLKKPCDLIVTDVSMPKLGGYELCRVIREKSEVPIIMVSANHDEIDRVLGLELGCDDYIAKPVSLREITVKIKNIFKRISTSAPTKNHIIEFKDLVIDVLAHDVILCDQKLPVTPKEFELLSLLVRNPHKAFTREELISIVWEYDYEGDTRQVDHVIKRLRKKMLENGGECQIQTVWGVGYKIGS